MCIVEWWCCSSFISKFNPFGFWLLTYVTGFPFNFYRSLSHWIPWHLCALIIVAHNLSNFESPKYIPGSHASACVQKPYYGSLIVIHLWDVIYIVKFPVARWGKEMLILSIVLKVYWAIWYNVHMYVWRYLSPGNIDDLSTISMKAASFVLNINIIGNQP